MYLVKINSIKETIQGSEEDKIYSIAHEIGHIYGLEDEYCSNLAGSTDERCNDGGVPGDYNGDGEIPSPDINYLSNFYGCDPYTGSCCNANDWICLNPNGCFFNGVKYANSGENYQRLCDSTSYAEPGILHVDYSICCRGNKNAQNGPSTMSYLSNSPKTTGSNCFFLDTTPSARRVPSFCLG